MPDYLFIYFYYLQVFDWVSDEYTQIFKLEQYFTSETLDFCGTEPFLGTSSWNFGIMYGKVVFELSNKPL